MKKSNDTYLEAVGQLKAVAVLAKTVDMMRKKDENNQMYIPKNIQLIDNILKVFVNLRKDLLKLLKEDAIENKLEKN